MKQERPLLIVTSCTRNYGWVTRAFLEGNTRWADYIVIVDQMSTDGTREMCAEYKNVVIVDDPDMTYKENTRAKMGFMKGRELAAGRDAIYFALDIDEVMPANWMQTEDGKKMLASKPGDMFQLEWANIMPDGKNYTQPDWQYKIFHDNGMDWQEVNAEIHTPLLPYTDWDIEPTKVYDFPLIHFGEYNEIWIKYKRIYYQFIDVKQHRSKSAISIFRKYHHIVDGEKYTPKPILQEWLYEDADIIGLVDNHSQPIFVQYIKEVIEKEGAKKFHKIDVWTKELCDAVGYSDPRSIGWKCMHAYLRVTQPMYSSFIIRGIDKILKYFIK